MRYFYILFLAWLENQASSQVGELLMDQCSFREALLAANPGGKGTVVVTFCDGTAAVVLGSAVDVTDTSEFCYPGSDGSTKIRRYEDARLVLQYHSSSCAHR